MPSEAAIRDFPNAYFETYEVSVESYEDFERRHEQVEALAERNSLTFYWRGQADATWGVHSSLHRRIAEIKKIKLADVMDGDVVGFERQIVDEAREWIRPSIGARLTTTDLLARLQHYGVPTRLVDFSRSPMVALFFAVMERAEVDGRIIIAAARHEVEDGFRNSFAVPWARREPTRPKGWANTLVALNDHEDFLRISRQEGVFLTGGTPSTGIVRTTRDGYRMGARHVRASMSIPLGLHGWVQAEAASEGRSARGRRPTVASALTLRIPRKVKAQLKRQLIGADYRTLFPDLGGFHDYSQSAKNLGLKSEGVERRSP